MHFILWTSAKDVIWSYDVDQIWTYEHTRDNPDLRGFSSNHEDYLINFEPIYFIYSPVSISKLTFMKYELVALIQSSSVIKRLRLEQPALFYQFISNQQTAAATNV